MTFKVMHGLRRVYGRLWHRRGKFNAELNDSLSGVRVVKAFAQEHREADRLGRRSEKLMIAAAEAESTWAALVPSFIFVMSSGSFFVWWFGGRQVLLDHISLGLLMSMLMLVGMLPQPLTIVVRLTDWMGRVFAAAERVFEVMDTPVEQADTDEVIPMPVVEGRVEFKNLTFGYDPHNPVLHDLNVEVAAGEMIGLVGRSGAGKSTTISLICRFYVAQEGELLIDGVNIKEISLKDLRRQIGVVPQEPYLFTGTIAENIAYAKADASIEEIIRAAKAANAHDFIVNFPDGYETQVGERGMGLSGGEKQRIAIARAILHDPKILILDEATSSIDTETEKQIQEALARLVKNRTTFAIAHRLSTLRNANRLLVLEHGKLVEIGTHDELLDKKGTYSKLVELQMELSKIKVVDG
jgi:ATP-binding cassette subfamily B protein